MAADPRLIVGLDLPSADQARAMVERLGDAVSVYKIGLTLLATGEGVALSRELRARGKQVFQDWKLHDIGAQVEGAARSVAEGGCDFLTVHAEPQVMAAAVKGRGSHGDTRILAVTVLTSLNDEALREIGYAWSAWDLVRRRVRQAVDAGCDGVVASPLEAAMAREVAGPGFLIVTPGVRPHGVGVDDQRRVATPHEALEAGASHLVVARPVLGAADPRAAAEAMAAEMAAS